MSLSSHQAPDSASRVTGCKKHISSTKKFAAQQAPSKHKDLMEQEKGTQNI